MVLPVGCGIAVAVQATLGTWDPATLARSPGLQDGLIAVRVRMNDDLRSRSTSRGKEERYSQYRRVVCSLLALSA